MSNNTSRHHRLPAKSFLPVDLGRLRSMGLYRCRKAPVRTKTVNAVQREVDVIVSTIETRHKRRT